MFNMSFHPSALCEFQSMSVFLVDKYFGEDYGLEDEMADINNQVSNAEIIGNFAASLPPWRMSSALNHGS